MDPSFLITQVTEEKPTVDNSPAKAIQTNGHVVNNAGDGQVGNKVGIEAKTNDIRQRFLPNLLSSHRWHKNGDVKPDKIFNSILCCLCLSRPNIFARMATKSRTNSSNHEESQPSHTIHRPSHDPRSPGTFVAKFRDLGQVATAKQNGHVTSALSTNERTSTLLPRLLSVDRQKLCVVIDLDETLVHSSFKPVNNADYIVPVNIDNIIHHVYVMKRPHVDTFLQRVGERFECILFTASLAKYADPVADLLDPDRIFKARLFREACVFHQGNYVKDLNKLGRDTEKVVIIDNSPASYVFHPQNAIPISSWFGDVMDRELLNVLPILDKVHAERGGVTRVLAQEIGNGVSSCPPKALPEA